MDSSFKNYLLPFHLIFSFLTQANLFFPFCLLKMCLMIGVRDHFRLGGGAQTFLPEFRRTWGGGGVFGGGEYYSFEVIVYIGNHGGGGCGRGTVATFLDLGVLKPGFGWVIQFKLTSTLAPNVYNDCSIRRDRVLGG